MTVGISHSKPLGSAEVSKPAAEAGREALRKAWHDAIDEQVDRVEEVATKSIKEMLFGMLPLFAVCVGNIASAAGFPGAGEPVRKADKCLDKSAECSAGSAAKAAKCIGKKGVDCSIDAGYGSWNRVASWSKK